jgi:hypothetical protein
MAQSKMVLSALGMVALVLLASAPAAEARSLKGTSSQCFADKKQELMALYCKPEQADGFADCGELCRGPNGAAAGLVDDCVRHCSECATGPCNSCEAFVTRFAKFLCG